MNAIKSSVKFLTVTALFEGATAIALLIVPQTLIQLLFEVAINEPIGILVAQIAGSALFAIAIACWLARKYAKEPSTRGLLLALLFYNITVPLLLAYGALYYSLISAGGILVAITHLLFAAWGAIVLLQQGSTAALK